MYKIKTNVKFTDSNLMDNELFKNTGLSRLSNIFGNKLLVNSFGKQKI